MACDSGTVMPVPTAEESAALDLAQPSPALQPREVIKNMMHALHKSNYDSPRMRFGCEVAIRFLAPSNPASKVSPERFGAYLSQTWYQPLLDWNEYRWEGDVTLLGDSEAFQQLSVRGQPDEPWVSVRWILKRVPFYATNDQWMIESVFVEEPDGAPSEMPLMPASDVAAAGAADNALLVELAAKESATDVVLKVMRAIRNLNQPYPFHGSEVAIRYCSPTNRASRLSPQSFAQYLDEPWYEILTEWDEISPQDPDEGDEIGTLSQDVLIKRADDDSWTIVNWQLSRHAGQWLTDALTIN